MSTHMSHTEVSEQLRAFALEELPSERSEDIRAHLAGCSACATEYRALQLLLELPAEELSEIESRRLHASVLEQLDTVEAAVAAPSPRPGGARGWVAQALGAAALLALIGGVGYLATTITGGAEQDVGGLAGDAQPESELVAEISEKLAFRRPQGKTGGALGKTSGDGPAAPEPGALTQTNDESTDQVVVADDDGAEAGGASADTFGTGPGGSVRPLYVRGAGILEDRTLNLVGRYGLPLVLFPSVYTPADAMELQTDFLAQLANAAENSDRQARVLQCGSSVLARPDPVLPALATWGRFENKPTLVMAFAWADSPDGTLDRFMVWSWPKGDCEAIPGYRAGYINR